MGYACPKARDLVWKNGYPTIRVPDISGSGSGIPEISEKHHGSRLRSSAGAAARERFWQAQTGGRAPRGPGRSSTRPREQIAQGKGQLWRPGRRRRRGRPARCRGTSSAAAKRGASASMDPSRSTQAVASGLEAAGRRRDQRCAETERTNERFFCLLTGGVRGSGLQDEWLTGEMECLVWWAV
jgi:hypothetical protein